MLDIILYTKFGDEVTTVRVPPFTPPPEIILWGVRYFVRQADGRYLEGMCWPILEGGF